FLSMCGVGPKDVKGLNPDVLCALDEHMDERKITKPGEPSNGYRRRYPDVVAALGRRKCEPWALTLREQAEVKAHRPALAVTGRSATGHLDALPYRMAVGERARRRRNTGDGARSREKRPLEEQLANRVAELSAAQYRTFQLLVKQEREKRRRQPRCTVCGQR